MDNDFDKEVREKLEVLKNLRPEQDGLLIAKDSYRITKAQMDLTALLFERLHSDIQSLSKSSKLLEKLTYTIIGLTAVLIGITIWEKVIPFFQSNL